MNLPDSEYLSTEEYTHEPEDQECPRCMIPMEGSYCTQCGLKWENGGDGEDEGDLAVGRPKVVPF